MKTYFDSYVFSCWNSLWDFDTSRLNGVTGAQLHAIQAAFHHVTGLSEQSIHWCSGLWLLMGDTASGKTTLQSALLRAINSNLQVWTIGEPGDPIFPYDDDSWNKWCTALAFADDYNPDERIKHTLFSANDRNLLRETDSDVGYCLRTVLLSQLRAYDFDAACTTLRRLITLSNSEDDVKSFQESLAQLLEFKIDKSTAYGSYADTLSARISPPDSNFINLDEADHNWIVQPASRLVMIDSLTQLPFKQSTLSYTTGGLAIDVFKAMAQLDYIARLKGCVLMATFNPTIFSKQIMVDFLNAVPGLATGSITVRTTDAPDTRVLDVASREYVEERDSELGRDALREIRYHDSFTYSLNQLLTDEVTDEQSHEEEYAPADFY